MAGRPAAAISRSFLRIDRTLRTPLALPSRRRPWAPTFASAALHLLVLALAAGLSRKESAVESAVEPSRPEAPRVDMIYMPPPPMEPERPQPAPPRPRRPPPPLQRTDPEPEPNAPPEAVPVTGAEQATEETAAGSDEAEPATPTETVATLESEARRIFGRRRAGTRPGAGPQALRPMEAWAPDNSERCVPQPAPARDTMAPLQLGTVVGRIFRQETGQPLAGAHLQMIGTPYVTFTDGRGEYRFRFDLALVDNCRTQYVKVSAPGYESRLLVLVVGPNRSEDVRLRRR